MAIIIAARWDTQFAVLLSIHKIQFNIFFVLSILLMASSFSYHLGLVGLITTVIINGSSMVYLCAIDRMQSALYNICLKSIGDNAEPENDSGVDDNLSPLSES